MKTELHRRHPPGARFRRAPTGAWRCRRPRAEKQTVDRLTDLDAWTGRRCRAARPGPVTTLPTKRIDRVVVELDHDHVVRRLRGIGRQQRRVRRRRTTRCGPGPTSAPTSTSKLWHVGHIGRGGMRRRPHEPHVCTRSSSVGAEPPERCRVVVRSRQQTSGHRVMPPRLARRSAPVGTPSPEVTSDHAAPGTWLVDDASDLADGLGDEVEPVEIRLAHAAARRVGRKAAADLEPTVVGERSGLAPSAEAVALQRQEDQRAERVVQLGDIDLGRTDVGQAPQLAGARPGRPLERIVAEEVRHGLVLTRQSTAPRHGRTPAAARRSRARSAEQITTAHAPSDSRQLSNRQSGSEIQRAAK